MKFRIEIPNISKDLDRQLKRLDHIIRDEFAREGEQIVTEVRTRSKEESWYDRTGNLRSSIGYVIAKDGKKRLGSSFDSVAGTDATGTEGSAKGMKYAADLAKVSQGWSLIIVAGMEYAEFVERCKGKDVLSSARLHVQQDMDSIAGSIQKRFDKGFK